jgi:hypothetical protein
MSSFDTSRLSSLFKLTLRRFPIYKLLLKASHEDLPIYIHQNYHTPLKATELTFKLSLQHLLNIIYKFKVSLYTFNIFPSPPLNN